MLTMALHPFIRMAIVPALLVTALVASACGSSGPEARQFDLEIREGKLALDPAVVRVNQGDSVTLRFRTDQAGAVHIHGYDIEQSVTPGQTASVQLTANATGRFTMTFHPGGEDGLEAHGALFDSPVLESNQTFSYQVGHDLEGKTFPYHNHMGHEFTGTITVSNDASLSGSVQIQILEDGSFQPVEVSVQPGTVLVWLNTSARRQRVTAGELPTGESGGMHQGMHQEEEVTLGTLEVYPR